MGTLAGFAAAGLIGRALLVAFGSVDEPGPLDLLLSAGLVVLLLFLRRRRAARAPVGVPSRADASSGQPMANDHPSGNPSLDQGVRDIRRTDPGFDPGRFTGYAGMMFRDAQSAWMTRDIESLRDRVTPEMHGALHAQCDRLRSIRRANRVEEIEIMAEVTEAWQESGRDYVTAYIGGSIVEYTVDEVSDRLVGGSRTVPRDVEEFWTFTRPAGFNFWMLSAIQTAGVLQLDQGPIGAPGATD